MPRLVQIPLIFFALACLLSWSVLGLFFVAGGTNGVFLALIGYLAMPAVAAVGLQRRRGNESIPESLGILFVPSRWIIVAWFLPVFLALLTFPVMSLLPQVSLSFNPLELFDAQFAKQTPEQLAALQNELQQAGQTMEQMREGAAKSGATAYFLSRWSGVFLAALTINGAAALFQEVGWRGLLVRELSPLGFWKQSFVIGLLWGLWHAPLVYFLGHNYPEHKDVGVLFMLAFCLLTTPIITYLRLRSRTVLAAALFHGAMNASASTILLFVLRGDDLWRGLTGVPGLALFALVNVVLAVRGAGREVQPELDALAPSAAPSLKAA